MKPVVYVDFCYLHFCSANNQKKQVKLPKSRDKFFLKLANTDREVTTAGHTTPKRGHCAF